MIRFAASLMAIWALVGLSWGLHQFVTGREERHRNHGSDSWRDILAFLVIAVVLGPYIFVGMMID